MTKYVNLDMLLDEGMVIEIKGRTFTVANVTAEDALRLTKAAAEIQTLQGGTEFSAESASVAVEAFDLEIEALATVMGLDKAGQPFTAKWARENMTMKQVNKLAESVTNEITGNDVPLEAGTVQTNQQFQTIRGLK